MPNVLKSNAVTSVGTSFSTVYTVPAGTTFVAGLVQIVNTTNTATTIRLCVVPSGSSAAQGNAILWDMPIAAYDILHIGKGMILPAGGTLQVCGGVANALNIKADGIEVS
jgi:hypothetical protein